MKAIKKVEVKIFAPGNTSFIRKINLAPQGQAFTAPGIDNILNHYAAELERVCPNEEYALKVIDAAHYNMVWTGTKPLMETA